MKPLRIAAALLIPIAVVVITQPGCSPANQASLAWGNGQPPPAAKTGVLDLTGWDSSGRQTVRPDGEWEFYWNRLLMAGDLAGEKPDLYAEVPSTWNRYSLSGKRLPGQGYATYRLHVRTSFPEGTPLGLRLYSYSSAYRLYVEDDLIASNGQVGTRPEDEVGEYRPLAAFFYAPAPEFDIIVQVSNFHYARGGFWSSASLGSAGAIRDLHDRIMGKESVVIGALAIASLFFLALYTMRTEFRYMLHFACGCLAGAIALDTVGQFQIVRIIPGISLKTVILIWYTSATWVPFFLILFVHELFKTGFSTFVVRAYLAVSIVSHAFYTFTHPVFYSRFADVGNAIDIVGVLCTIIIVAVGMRKDYRDGWLHIAAMVIVLVSYVHDTLYWTNRIEGVFGEIVYIGLMAVILIEMIVVARRVRDYYDQKTAAELSFLQAQIKPHFLYNAINTFVSISYYDMEKARDLLVNFGNYLRRCFDFKDLSQSVPLKHEIELARAYADIEKARFEDRLEIHFDVYDDLEAKVPILMLQPVVENAVNHGVLPRPEGGRVDVLVRRQGRLLVFSVKDNGVGMDLKAIGETSEREFGSGVGLSNIDSRLRRLYGKGLHIESIPGSGTEVTWSVPV